eukprot:CAMPEP_0195148616 /NCGR_PEP_ID=MMETSP0448-20130528/175591_1 /TAXON_ID=66468 /ORGANISM="Heterocapsa triquestra, Strain CCMP 448" /LENGTH=56 /DNA_ID=CAMNT_0040187233 /DNA_START=119 /DNA_END=285 /DNA_ORIENTATION=-
MSEAATVGARTMLCHSHTTCSTVSASSTSPPGNGELGTGLGVSGGGPDGPGCSQRG